MAVLATWDVIQVLLIPSLWREAWGLVVVEAQISGIPIISSDAGVLLEAKLNVPYIVLVSKLTGGRGVNGHVCKPQDVDSWV